MVPRQEKHNVAESRRPLMPKDQGKRPQGIKKQRPQQSIRKSARLQERIVPKGDAKYLLPSPSISTTPCKGVKQISPKAANFVSPQHEHETTRKRKRSQAEAPWGGPAEKRVQTIPVSYVVEDKEAARNTNQSGYLVEHWIQEESWPKEYFKPVNMDLLPKKKKSFASLRGGDSEVNSSFTGGDATQAARNPEYEKLLIVAGISLDEGTATTMEDCITLCDLLLNGEQTVPEFSLFQDNLARSTFSRYLRRNESMVFRDITPLIVPSAELLYVKGSTHLEHVREDLDTLWTKCVCLATGPRPKPDFAAGLKESVFTQAEYEKLMPYIGGSNEACYVKVTNDIFFPFLTCETKCGEVGLAVADRQNAHSASIAANAIVQLYKAVGRETEINKKPLTFSISHDNESARIYCHYALIDGEEVTFGRHPIDKFNFTARNGKEKWTAYKFTRNVYDKFLPVHVKRVKSAVIQLQDPKDVLVKSLASIASAEKDQELPDSQEMASSPQVMRSQKRRKPPPKVMLQQENDRQRQEIDELRREKDNQTGQFMRQLELQREDMNNQISQLKGQIDLLLKQQALLLSQIENGLNASPKLQTSEASGLSQVFENQSLLLQPNHDSLSNLVDSITSTTSLSHGTELKASQQPKKRRAAQ